MKDFILPFLTGAALGVGATIMATDHKPGQQGKPGAGKGKLKSKSGKKSTTGSRQKAGNAKKGKGATGSRPAAGRSSGKPGRGLKIPQLTAEQKRAICKS